MMTSWLRKALLEFISGQQVTLDDNTSLNEKYNILMNHTILKGTMPRIRYYGLGNGGIGDPIKVAYHSDIDGDLFEPIPFIAREVVNDLSVEERILYRIRVEKEIDGIVYALYYLKKLDNSSNKVVIKKLEKTTVSTASVSTLDTNTSEILNPVPRITSEIDMEKSVFHTVENSFSIAFTEEEKGEMISAYQLVTGNEDVPRLTELCLYSGEDTYDGDALEAFAVRAAYFYTMPYELQTFLNDEGYFQRYINIGGMRLY